MADEIKNALEKAAEEQQESRWSSFSKSKKTTCA